MNYEQKYNDALDLARTYHDGYIIQGHVGEAEILEDIFTELRKSEDERIRKTLICGMNTLKNNQKKKTFATIPIDDCIAWLEKQGEKDPCIGCTNDKGCVTCENGNMKETKSEPKFHPGDWIVDNIGNIFQIEWVFETIAKDIFGYITVGGVYFNDNNDVRLWTIADAKDGDVLATEDGRPFIIRCMVKSENDIPSAYCGINARPSEAFIITGYNQGTSKWTNSKVHPATKEQRDLLFQKMKGAGYEWDAEKKELKKIEMQDNQVVSEVIKNQKEMPGEFTKSVYPDFWDLIKTAHKMLDANKVIEWLNDQACQGWIEDVEVDKFVEKFKKDFGL